MQAFECRIIRVAIAAALGSAITFLLLLNHGVLVAAALSPLAGSAAAMSAITLFWFVSLFVPRKPMARPELESAR
jgi:hypothetical protein